MVHWIVLITYSIYNLLKKLAFAEVSLLGCNYQVTLTLRGLVFQFIFIQFKSTFVRESCILIIEGGILLCLLFVLGVCPTILSLKQ